MKRLLLSMLMLVSLLCLVARPTLVVETEGEGDTYALLRGVVERVSEHSLLSRLEGEGVLTVTIADLLAEGEHALSASVVFSYEGRTLPLFLNVQAKDAKHLEKEVEKRLLSLLVYDALSLTEAEDALVVDYTYNSGYATLASLRRGDHYKGLDAQGNRWATAVVQQVTYEESPLSLLVATGGKALLPGMRLQVLKGREVAFVVSSTLSATPSLAFDSSYSQDIGLYPFSLVVGAGFDLGGKDHSFSSLSARAGFAVTLPLSMVFGINSGFWRNSSLVMECTLGIGYAFSEQTLVYGSGAVATYRYRLQDYYLTLALGNKHWASEKESFSSGLFMQLGLAYTW